MVKRPQDNESTLLSRKRTKETALPLSASKDTATTTGKPWSNGPSTRRTRAEPSQPASDNGGPTDGSSMRGTVESSPVTDKALINVPNNDKSENKDDQAGSAESTTVSLNSPTSPTPGPSTPDDWPQSPRASPTPTGPPGRGSAIDMAADPADRKLRELFADIKYVPTDVLRRLLSFTNKDDPKNRRYSLANIPSNAKWGSTPPNDKFLCIDNEPITVWALANVESTWFTDLDGNPHGRVNLGFRLPFSGDNLHADRLYLKANPPLTDKDDVKFSGHYMKRFEKGSKTATIMPFEAIYDATRRFKAKSDMAMISSSNIGKRDIVLVESNFTRWKEGDVKKIRKWTEWKAGFDLHAVSLLFEAPPGVELEPDAPNVDDADDDL